MAASIWSGFISFGLVAIPVRLYSIEKKKKGHFHLLDARDKSRVRYERVNEKTGKEVPWDKVVKGFEYDKDDYVVVDEDAFLKADPEAVKTIDIEEFVNFKDVDPLYFDRPYYLMPDGRNKKAYVLLREALKRKNKVGVAKAILRKREYLVLILPHEHALVLYLLRFSQDLKKEDELNFPTDNIKDYKINDREIKMATDLIEEMSAAWKPEKYQDDYENALMDWIDDKMPKQRVSAKPERKQASGEVVDFMSLLKKSMDKKSEKKRPLYQHTRKRASK